jgi:hypothetical protein
VFATRQAFSSSDFDRLQRQGFLSQLLNRPNRHTPQQDACGCDRCGRTAAAYLVCPRGCGVRYCGERCRAESATLEAECGGGGGPLPGLSSHGPLCGYLARSLADARPRFAAQRWRLEVEGDAVPAGRPGARRAWWQKLRHVGQV